MLRLEPTFGVLPELIPGTKCPSSFAPGKAVIIPDGGANHGTPFNPP